MVCKITKHIQNNAIKSIIKNSASSDWWFKCHDTISSIELKILLLNFAVKLFTDFNIRNRRIKSITCSAEKSFFSIQSMSFSAFISGSILIAAVRCFAWCMKTTTIHDVHISADSCRTMCTRYKKMIRVYGLLRGWLVFKSETSSKARRPLDGSRWRPKPRLRLPLKLSVN